MRDEDVPGGGRCAKNGIAEMVSMRALECLVTIVEQGSLTKAAAVLHMPQPALSTWGADENSRSAT
jgi:hypothetical protein